MSANTYILTLSCKDIVGIVASVSTFLAEHDGFILESQQFGDFSTNRFFMRTEFQAGPKMPPHSQLAKLFEERVAKRFGMEWELRDQAKKIRLVVMVSKFGHCLNDIIHRVETGSLHASIAAVVSNHEDFRKVVEWHGMPFHYLPVTPETKDKQEAKLLEIVAEQKADLVALARYMQILSPTLCDALKGRAINIHHSFLPSFKGANPYRQAYDRGVKLIGATAHYVTTDLDEGPIIEQEVIRVDHSNKPEDLKAMGCDIETIVFARAIKYHAEHRVLLNGNKTVVFK